MADTTNTVTGAIIFLIIAGFSLILIAQTGSTLGSTGASFNESRSYTNGTLTSLTNTDLVQSPTSPNPTFVLFNITKEAGDLNDNTSMIISQSGNYTINYLDGQLTVINSRYAGGALQVNYTYTDYGQAGKTARSLVTNIGGAASLAILIVIVAIAGMVFMAFKVMKRDE